MKLIADSGSTKATWRLLDKEGNQKLYSTEGYNPYFMTTDAIEASVNLSLVPLMNADEITEIFFYGAGCSSADKNLIVKKALQLCFPNANVSVEHDLTAAGRAVLQHEEGFVGILGTGTNTGLYDGKNISHNIDSLGYFLGDEGSGCWLGKRLLRDHLRNYLPINIEKKLIEICPMNAIEIWDRILHQPQPNRFLASFSKFIGDNIQDEYCQSLVKEGFHEFFRNIVSHYPEFQNQTFNCVGSVAFYFQDFLHHTADMFDMPFGKIIQAPIDGLVAYHTI